MNITLLHALEELSTPVLCVDGESRINHVNAAAATWLGASKRRLIGRDLALLDGTDGALTAAVLQLLQRPGSLRCRHIRLLCDVGERFAEVYASPLEGRAGLLLEFHPTDEFPGADPATTLPAALSAALKGLAHEVKNPLAGLKGAAQLLERRIADSDARATSKSSSMNPRGWPIWSNACSIPRQSVRLSQPMSTKCWNACVCSPKQKPVGRCKCCATTTPVCPSCLPTRIDSRKPCGIWCNALESGASEVRCARAPSMAC